MTFDDVSSIPPEHRAVGADLLMAVAETCGDMARSAPSQDAVMAYARVAFICAQVVRALEGHPTAGAEVVPFKRPPLN